MSRVGKNPVEIPSGVDVKVGAKTITVKGKLGELTTILAGDMVEAKVEGNKFIVANKQASKHARMVWGTTRNNVRSMIEGVTNGYKKNLEIAGVGYRAEVAGQVLKMKIGFSHEVLYTFPKGISITVDKQTNLEIKGIDKKQVGQIAAEIRALKKPEPYKLTGIKYQGEEVEKKEGKKK